MVIEARETALVAGGSRESPMATRALSVVTRPSWSVLSGGLAKGRRTADEK